MTGGGLFLYERRTIRIRRGFRFHFPAADNIHLATSACNSKVSKDSVRERSSRVKLDGASDLRERFVQPKRNAAMRGMVRRR
jgi:hypothetical protein